MLVVLLTARVALAAAVLSGSAVHAPTGRAEGGLALGVDGAHWSTTLDDPLFLPAVAWRPGDDRVSTFLVHNTTGTTTDVGVEVSRAASPSDPYLVVSLSTAGHAPVEVDPGGEQQVLVRDLGPSATTAVTLRASLSAQAPDGTTVGADLVRYRVDAVPPEPGVLARSRLGLAPLFLGIALLGTAWVLGRRRVRQAAA